MKEKHQKLSVFISLILRHKPEVIDIQLDNFGYAKVNELIEGINKHNKYKIDITILEQIVDTDSKMRYSFNKDKTKIRANQGHSIDVDLMLESVVPPNILWHGTSTQNIDSIKFNGLNKRSRQFVHLSENRELAYQVGTRHGNPTVLLIASLKMYEDGYDFYLSDNNVWLTKEVPPKYISLRSEDNEKR